MFTLKSLSVNVWMLKTSHKTFSIKNTFSVFRMYNHLKKLCSKKTKKNLLWFVFWQRLLVTTAWCPSTGLTWLLRYTNNHGKLYVIFLKNDFSRFWSLLMFIFLDSYAHLPLKRKSIGIIGKSANNWNIWVPYSDISVQPWLRSKIFGWYF